MSIAQPVEQAHRHQPALPVAKLGKACVDIAGLNHVAIFLLGHPRHLAIAMARVDVAAEQRELFCGRARRDRKSVVAGKSVSVRVDFGGRRMLQKKNYKSTMYTLKHK